MKAVADKTSEGNVNKFKRINVFTKTSTKLHVIVHLCIILFFSVSICFSYFYIYIVISF